VFYREAERIGGNGLERVYYIAFKQGGKVFEEKVGRQFKDDMTPPGLRESAPREERGSGNPGKKSGKRPRLLGGLLTGSGKSTMPAGEPTAGGMILICNQRETNKPIEACG
jgi:hypothetical protein